jgi:hypothetical protein
MWLNKCITFLRDLYTSYKKRQNVENQNLLKYKGSTLKRQTSYERTECLIREVIHLAVKLRDLYRQQMNTRSAIKVHNLLDELHVNFFNCKSRVT